MKLKPIGPQPPTEPGLYWMEWDGNLDVVELKPYCFDKTVLVAWFVGDECEKSLHGFPRAIFQPVAKPEVCDD